MQIITSIINHGSNIILPKKFSMAIHPFSDKPTGLESLQPASNGSQALGLTEVALQLAFAAVAT